QTERVAELVGGDYGGKPFELVRRRIKVDVVRTFEDAVEIDVDGLACACVLGQDLAEHILPLGLVVGGTRDETAQRIKQSIPIDCFTEHAAGAGVGPRQMEARPIARRTAVSGSELDAV